MKQELEAETTGEFCSPVRSSNLSSWLPDTSQIHFPKDGTAHGGLGPSVSIINQETPTDVPTGQSGLDDSSFEFPSYKVVDL